MPGVSGNLHLLDKTCCCAGDHSRLLGNAFDALLQPSGSKRKAHTLMNSKPLSQLTDIIPGEAKASVIDLSSSFFAQPIHLQYEVYTYIYEGRT